MPESFPGVIIPRQPEQLPRGPAFDESGLPTSEFVDDHIDPVIACLTLEFCNARRANDEIAVIGLMKHMVMYGETVERYCTLPKVAAGKQNILESFFDMGIAYVYGESLEIPRQPQA